MTDGRLQARRQRASTSSAMQKLSLPRRKSLHSRPLLIQRSRLPMTGMPYGLGWAVARHRRIAVRRCCPLRRSGTTTFVPKPVPCLALLCPLLRHRRPSSSPTETQRDVRKGPSQYPRLDVGFGAPTAIVLSSKQRPQHLAVPSHSTRYNKLKARVKQFNYQPSVS